ncbi:unnamed protein product, partial [Tetraodon nigroviridis]
PRPGNAITIAVSSRVLFNMEKEQQIYEQQGMEEYIRHQVEHETQPFCPGPAFSFIKALEAVNTRLREIYPESEELFDVVLMTNNHANVGLRLINTINHYQLFIERFCMTGGNSPIGYLKAYHTNLYLSADPVKVREALEEGGSGGRGHGAAPEAESRSDSLFRVQGSLQPPCSPRRRWQQCRRLSCASPSTVTLCSSPTSPSAFSRPTAWTSSLSTRRPTRTSLSIMLGPLKCFLEALGKLQRKFYDKGQRLDCPIRTYLVTARSAASSGTRALKTLRSWGLEIDEALFLAGAPKGPMLEKIRPHIFFDDQMFHVEGAAEMGTVACHVPYGIAQR